MRYGGEQAFADTTRHRKIIFNYVINKSMCNSCGAFQEPKVTASVCSSATRATSGIHIHVHGTTEFQIPMINHLSSPILTFRYLVMFLVSLFQKYIKFSQFTNVYHHTKLQDRVLNYVNIAHIIYESVQWLDSMRSFERGN